VTVGGLRIAAEPFESADARTLVAELDAGLAELYTPEQHFGRHFSTRHLDDGRGIFLVARIDGEPAGCGAFTLLDGQTAELKRMYVRPVLRGHGIAGAVLERLETKARALGVSRLVLETGIHQDSAIRLYERAGFRKVECWGEYTGVPTSVCYDKPLD
jgi:putative acetyltransferase